MRESADGIESQIVFRAYAWTAGALGGFVYSWGVLFLRTLDLPGIPFGRAAALRVLGGVMMAAACCAAGMARIDAPESRQRALVWFASAHLVLWAAFFLQWWAILGEQVAAAVAWAPLAVALVLLYCAFPEPLLAPGRSGSLISLFGGTGPLSLTSRLAGARSRYEEHVRQMARHEERARLARDLHDAVKQQLFVVQTAAATAEARFDTDAAGARRAIADARAATREAMTELEVMLDQLNASPLEAAGLVETLRKQVEAFGYRTGARATFELDTMPAPGRLAPGTSEAVFRIAQEALSNVARHARANEVTVRLGGGAEALELLVHDNGAGFAADRRPGLGTASMNERASALGGTLDVSSRPGAGTTVRCRIPTAWGAPTDYRDHVVGRGAMLASVLFIQFWTVGGLFVDPLHSVITVVVATMFGRALVAWLQARARVRVTA